jgi:uncharacterized protein with GYD domain
MIGRNDMPLFMASIKYSAASTKALVEKPHDRRSSAKAALEAAGCTLKEVYFALGPVDAIAIYEAPDALTAASVSMVLGASGAASSVETMQLFSTEEAMTAMTKAGQVQRSYKPPTAA